MKRVNIRHAIGIWLLLMSAPASAHKPSDSYLSLSVQGTQVQGQWDIALRDLDYALGLDANDDGALTWGEVRTRHAHIATYALAHLRLQRGGEACPTTVTEQLLDTHSDGAYHVLRFRAACTQEPRTLDIEYTLFFDLDPQHKGLLRLGHAGTTQTVVFDAQHTTRRIALDGHGTWRALWDYGVQGGWHIWSGYDHLLFLLILLVPAVLRHERTHWQGVENFRAALLDTAKVVTAFTVAHSITLSTATLGLVSLPSRWVESAIAASIIIAAMNNIVPVWQMRRWPLALVFGLIHGFGFASVLTDLGLPAGALAGALLGFNLGVETGQMVIVMIFLPLAFVVRVSLFYRYTVYIAGSAAAAGLAGIWLVERAFNLRLLAI